MDITNLDPLQYLLFFAAFLYVIGLKSGAKWLAEKIASKPGGDDWAISPFLRLLSALVLACFTYLAWQDAVALLSHNTGVATADCSRERRFFTEWLCNISNAILTSIEPAQQGPAGAAAGFLLCFLLLFLIWLLLKPLLKIKN